MARETRYSHYAKPLVVLFFSLVAAAIVIILAAKKATVSPLPPQELTNASFYAEKNSGENSRDSSLLFTANDDLPIAADGGPGGPILVISSITNSFSRYAVEILKAEGLNEFAASDISTVTPAELNKYDVVIVGEMILTTAQVSLLTEWVNAGGTLIAFKPCELLTPLLGISAAKSTLTDKYLLVNTAPGPGAGIVDQTIQFHGTANLHILTGATNLATLYSNATTATTYPAVITRDVGSKGGKAIAFTYDLARSVIYTRQGNPAWAGQKRDGEIDPIRSDDMFFGRNSPDWIDFDKIAIPQADEQQRLLANIILQNNLHRKPLPRFWYLPRDLKAAIVMASDDHGSNSGTVDRFNQYLRLGSNTPQDVADWKAVRASSYVYAGTPISNEQAMAFEAQGFEIALHPNTGCQDYTFSSLQNVLKEQLYQFASAYPGIAAPVTSRNHCLAWSDWASAPKAELEKGIRLDATYYYWPAAWIQNRPGMFTGSGMPMRFADTDGSIIDVYQLATQMTDESGITYTAFCNALLDKAIGPEGYYGVFTANMHADEDPSKGSDEIIASAQARQVPVISAKQMLTWLDGRNNSFFSDIVWKKNQLSFSITAHRGTNNNLKAMLPLYAETGQLGSVTQDGKPVAFTVQTIKGMQYAFFAAPSGKYSYTATYNKLLAKKKPPVKKIIRDELMAVRK